MGGAELLKAQQTDVCDFHQKINLKWAGFAPKFPAMGCVDSGVSGKFSCH